MPVQNDYSHEFQTGDHVKILTKCGGCYDHITGIVTEKLNNDLQPDPGAKIPHFYRVQSDRPVDIGDGVLSSSDIHPSREVFPIDTPVRNYWDAGRHTPYRTKI